MQKIIKIILLFCFAFQNSICLAQSSNIDSLLSILDKQEGIQRMETLRLISTEYMNKSVEEAIKYARELLMIAEEQGNLKYIDLASSFLGEAHFYMDDIDKSIEYFEKFLKTNIKQDDIDGIATAYNNLGIVYRYIEKYETAIQYYLESLAIKERLKDTAGLCTTLNNIGVLYFYMGNYNNALKYYKRSYELEKSLNNKSGIATSLLNIGEVHSVLNNFSKALDYFERSIELSESVNDQHTLEVNYRCMYDMYKRKLDFQKALYYFELYNDLKNERLSQESRKEIAELEIQYETSKKEKEIGLLHQQNRLGRIIIIILSAAFLIFTFLMILLIKQGRAKKKALNLLSEKNNKITEQTLILNKLNTTKDKFFSIISHDLKSAIGGFMAQSEFLAEDFKELPQDKMHNLIVNMHQSSQQLYSLLENLLEWSKSQRGNIKVQPEKFKLKKLVESILPVFNELMEEKNIQAIINISPDMTVFADINMISTILRNLITNAIKFSYPDGRFTITAKAINGYAEIEVADEGVGISNKDKNKLFNIDQSFSTPGTRHEKGSGLGLIICKEFVLLNQGKIWVDTTNEKGTSIKFTLKLA